MTACYLPLANGWTVSISPYDTPPALCSVAAWPTALQGARLRPEDWFDFDGRCDCRCWTLNDVRAALALVAASEAPAMEPGDLK